jgi:hypothetical protein
MYYGNALVPCYEISLFLLQKSIDLCFNLFYVNGSVVVSISLLIAFFQSFDHFIIWLIDTEVPRCSLKISEIFVECFSIQKSTNFKFPHKLSNSQLTFIIYIITNPSKNILSKFMIFNNLVFMFFCLVCLFFNLFYLILLAKKKTYVLSINFCLFKILYFIIIF